MKKSWGLGCFIVDVSFLTDNQVVSRSEQRERKRERIVIGLKSNNHKVILLTETSLVVNS